MVMLSEVEQVSTDISQCEKIADLQPFSSCRQIKLIYTAVVWSDKVSRILLNRVFGVFNHINIGLYCHLLGRVNLTTAMLDQKSVIHFSKSAEQGLAQRFE